LPLLVPEGIENAKNPWANLEGEPCGGTYLCRDQWGGQAQELLNINVFAWSRSLPGRACSVASIPTLFIPSPLWILVG
jgi:hypothetical protein